jgi:hypothetical protein
MHIQPRPDHPLTFHDSEDGLSSQPSTRTQSVLDNDLVEAKKEEFFLMITACASLEPQGNQNGQKELHASELSLNSKKGIMTILHQFTGKAAR